MQGTYQATVLSTALATSKNKGTPSVKIQFGTEFNINDMQTPVRKSLYVDLWLTDATFDRTMDTLTMLGWDGADLNALNGTELLCGKEAWVVVAEEEYEGKVRDKIQFVNPVGGGQSAQRMEDKDAADLAKKLKAKVLKYRQNKPQAAKQAAQEAPEAESDDFPL